MRVFTGYSLSTALQTGTNPYCLCEPGFSERFYPQRRDFQTVLKTKTTSNNLSVEKISGNFENSASGCVDAIIVDYQFL